MSNLITWKEGHFNNRLFYGYTEQNLKNDDVQTYLIDTCSLTARASDDGYYKGIESIRCESLEDAKQLAEIIERGRVAE